jgi:hypothetical protein
MLTTINLNYEFEVMTDEISNVMAQMYLPTKMSVGRSEAISQMPPQFALCIGRRRTHRAGAHPVDRNDTTVAACPNPRV